MAVTLVYETHSTTEDNEAGIATGWRPGRLSEAGRAQAARLGLRRRDDGLAAVFVSDLARAVETATIALAGSPLPVHQDSRLRECDYGALTGCPADRLAAARARHVDRPFPGGQSYRQVAEATAGFLRDLRDGWDGARILVIAHSANLWALEHLLAGARLEDLARAPPPWRPGWTYVVP
ncbi:histidine phosphatase family protein [Inquilinus limosus]|uniref:Histidine phosphatase family protein n=1 Tax=Inquilinus limosus TaxID=171674 RepID=A0A211YS60_9PROT|nr:histidine phosphatase family protein [Inquilinus limosus]OWJ55905.1 histidine phosphatase family protein [Inquilinus limosus]